MRLYRAISNARLCAVLMIVNCHYGCATTPKEQRVWARADGGSVRETLEEQQKFRMAVAVCKGESQKAGLAGSTVVIGRGNVFEEAMRDVERGQAMDEVFVGCMAQQNYAFLLQSEVDRLVAARTAKTQSAKTQSQNVARRPAVAQPQ